jgi:hypothetical protein
MNSTVVREIRRAKINPKSSFKHYGAQNMRGRKLREQIRYIGHHSLKGLQNFGSSLSKNHRYKVPVKGSAKMEELIS